MYPHKILGLFYLYGLMIAIGILACFAVLTICGKKFKIQEKFVDFVYFNAIVAIALGFGAAALFQATYNYIDNPAAGFDLKGGITFIGGLIGGIISFLTGYAIFRKRYKARVTDILSIAPCCILIAHAFGRIGCFFAGCCHGPETDAWYGIYMYASSFGKYAKVVPTHLFEAIFLFALFAICFILLWKKHFRYNLSVYLIAYGVFRFCLEFLRADDRGSFIPGVSPSQFWSILMVVSGIGLIFLMRWLFKQRDAELALAAAQAKAEAEKAEAEKTKAEAEKQTQEKSEEKADGASNTVVWREAGNGESVETTQSAETEEAETQAPQPADNTAESFVEDTKKAEGAETENSVSEAQKEISGEQPIQNAETSAEA